MSKGEAGTGLRIAAVAVWGASGVPEERDVGAELVGEPRTDVEEVEVRGVEPMDAPVEPTLRSSSG